MEKVGQVNAPHELMSDGQDSKLKHMYPDAAPEGQKDMKVRPSKNANRNGNKASEMSNKGSQISNSISKRRASPNLNVKEIRRTGDANQQASEDYGE